jgi:PIN domain nuclease of toxin-antitoxin system
MALLLDTHVWLWLAEGTRRLGEECLRQIEEEARNRQVMVSVMSVWEIAMLEAHGRIVLSGPCADWVRAALASDTVALAPLTPEIAVASTRLPGNMHSDPMDRFLVATARALGATLVTRDRHLIDYGRRGHVEVMVA